MMQRPDAEQGYVLSLLRQGGEEADAPLARYRKAPPVEPDDIENDGLAQLLVFILKNVELETSVSAKLAAREMKWTEASLQTRVEDVDKDGIVTYAEAVLDYSARGKITSVADKAQELLKEDSTPREALDGLTEHIASIRLADEASKITPLPEGTRRWLKEFDAHQAAMQRGDKRFAIPLRRMGEFVPYIMKGQVVLLTAQTKVGKTAFASQAFDWNIKHGLRGIYFHFEDTPYVMGIRRVARQMSQQYNDAGQPVGIPLTRLLVNVLSTRERAIVKSVNEDVAQWPSEALEVHCAGWTMEQVCRVWRRHVHDIDFVIIDYLNKAYLTPAKLKGYGLYAARGQDAELVKVTAESTNTVAILVQQEGDNYKPFETRQSAQKAQVHISLQRDRLDDHRLDLQGKLVVLAANLGKTGSIPVSFIPDWMVWADDN